MNEQERFEDSFDEIQRNYHWVKMCKVTGRALWQARDEIAKQDEKDLIAALIQLCSDKHSLELSIGIAIDIIEKHTGKTWEELNG